MMSSNGESRTSRVGSRASGQGDLVDFKEVVHFFRRHWLLIFALTALFPVVTLGYLAAFSSPVYEASAMLVVLPPSFSSELTPKSLSLQGYQRLLESDGVVAETLRRLAEKKLVDDNGLRIGDQLDARIFVSRRAEERPLAPVIEVVGRAGTPLKAAALANIWAEVFLERVQELRAGSTLPAVEFIEQQYGRQRSDLVNLQEIMNAAADSYQERIDETSLDWSRRIREASFGWERRLTDFRKETETSLSRYQLETRRTLQEFAKDNGLSTSQTSDVPADLRRPLLHMLSLRIQLAQTPELLVLRKAVSDEALWQALVMSRNDRLTLSEMSGQHLVSEELNPAHIELVLRLSQLETELEDQSTGGLDSVRLLATGLEKLQRERSAGVTQLIASRALERSQLESQRDFEIRKLNDQMEQAVSSLERERDLSLGQFEMDVERHKRLFEELGKNNSQAQLARAEQDLDEVRLAVAAVASGQPMPRGRALKALIAILVGGLLGTLVALVREVL